MLLMLQARAENRQEDAGDVPADAVTKKSNGHHHSIWGKVVRVASDGIGVQFLHSNPRERYACRHFLAGVRKRGQVVSIDAQPASLPSGEQVPDTVTPEPEPGNESSSGQALIEFALILPLLFLLIVNVVNFGGFLYAWIAVSNAARSGAEYMIRGGASVGAPSPPTVTQVQDLVHQDLVSLPNGSGATVRVCTNNNSVSSCGVSYTPPADPENGSFVLAAIDVSYAYQPLIPLWEFPSLHIHATIPQNTTIHRQALMRVMQ
jgi:hypothetical protein